MTPGYFRPKSLMFSLVIAGACTFHLGTMSRLASPVMGIGGMKGFSGTNDRGHSRVDGSLLAHLVRLHPAFALASWTTGRHYFVSYDGVAASVVALCPSGF